MWAPYLYQYSLRLHLTTMAGHTESTGSQAPSICFPLLTPGDWSVGWLGFGGVCLFVVFSMSQAIILNLQLRNTERTVHEMDGEMAPGFGSRLLCVLEKVALPL